MMNKPWLKKNPRTTFHPGRSSLLVIWKLDLKNYPTPRGFHLISLASDARNSVKRFLVLARNSTRSMAQAALTFLDSSWFLEAQRWKKIYILYQRWKKIYILYIYIYIFFFHPRIHVQLRAYMIYIHIYLDLHIKKHTYLIVFVRTWKLCFSLSLRWHGSKPSHVHKKMYMFDSFICVYKHMATISLVSFWDLITLALTIGSNHFYFKSKFNPPSWALFYWIHRVYCSLLW